MPSTTVEIRGQDKTKKAFSSVDKSMKRMKTSMGGLKGAVAGLIGGGAFGALVVDLADTADKLGKTSARLGIASDELQKLRYAAEQSGIEVGTFDMALQRFVRRTSDAAVGKSKAVKDAFEEMGIKINDQDGRLKTTTDLLKEVASAFEKIPDQSDKVRIAFKLFDSEGVKMVNMLQQGSGAIEAMGEQLDSYGGIVNDKAIKASEQFNDRLGLMKQASSGFLTSLVELVNKGLDPFFEKTEKMKQAIIDAKDARLESIKAERTYVESIIEGISGLGSAELKLSALSDKQKEMNIRRLSSIALLDQLAKRNKLGLRNDKEGVKARNMQIIGLTNYISKLIEANNAIEIHKNLLRDGILINEDMIQQSHDMFDTKAFLIEEESRLEKESMERRKAGIAEQEELHKKLRARMFKDDETYFFSKNKLEEQSFRSTMSTMEAMAAGVKDEGIVLFRFWQAAAIANTWMSTHEAAMKASAQLGIFGAFAAGAMYVLGAAQIAKIAGTPPPGKQAGGDVMAGQPYLVGERGPELFTPGQTGSIAPNRNSGQGVIINIYDGTGRKISQAMSDLRVEVVERANSFGQFAALESPLYTDAATA